MTATITKVYKIRHNNTGNYSSGGEVPHWTEKGKTWTNKSGLGSHLRLVGIKQVYRDAQVITFEIITTELPEEAVSVNNYIVGLNERAGKRA